MGLFKKIMDSLSGSQSAKPEPMRGAPMPLSVYGNAQSESKRAVAFYSLDPMLTEFAREKLAPELRHIGYLLYISPPPLKALHHAVLMMDVSREADAKLHPIYDQILRQKKTLRKTRDILVAIGPREDAKRYPRGTYPGLVYFCRESAKEEKRHPDLTLTGQPIPGGPTLYDFADIIPVLKQILK